jgi:hypothetical protein
MLGRLVLVLLQLAVGWLAAPHVAKYVPSGGDLKPVLMAVVFAVIVFLTGVVGSVVLKEVAMPSSRALTSSLVLALVGAGLLFVPQIWQAVGLKVDRLLVPLIGAVLGYQLRR